MSIKDKTFLLQGVIERLQYKEFVSGQQLADELKVSRGVIADTVSELVNMGLDIFVVRGRGYKLMTALQPVSSESVQANLSPLVIQNCASIQTLFVVNSTNDVAWQCSLSNGKSWALVISDYQTAGRGQRGRHWFAPPQASLLWSMRVRQPLPLTLLPHITLMVGLALVQSISEVAPEVKGKMALKWPNDVYLERKKLAGVLCEAKYADDVADVVIGVGVNLQFSDIVQQQVGRDIASLSEFVAANDLRLKLAALLVEKVLQGWRELSAANGVEALHQEWRRYDMLLGKTVVAELSSENLVGTAVGVDEKGCLKIDVAGVLRSVAAGDVSIKVAS